MAEAKKIEKKKDEPKKPTTREGKVYQIKDSAARAAKEDGLGKGEFELKQSSRKDGGWYYLKITPKDAPPLPGKVQAAVADVLINSKDVNDVRTGEMIRTIVEATSPKTVAQAEAMSRAKLDSPPIPRPADPPPLPSEQTTEKKKSNPSPSIPKLHRSTIEGPTKAVWHIAEEMHTANPNVRRTEVTAECVRRGIAFFTARTQYQQWRTAKLESDRNASLANTPKK
jgi:hypothetical protein